MIEVQVLGPDDWQLWRTLHLEALTESASAFSSTLAQWTGLGDTEERWRARLSIVPMNVVRVLITAVRTILAGGVHLSMSSGFSASEALPDRAILVRRTNWESVCIPHERPRGHTQPSHHALTWSLVSS
jgi:hypothetical protein